MSNQSCQDLSSTRYVISASNLPLLTGSDDQITWAKTIRIDMLLSANHVLAHLNQEMHAGLFSSRLLNEAIQASQRLQNMATASWWITHRDHEMKPLLQKLSQRNYTLEFQESP